MSIKIHFWDNPHSHPERDSFREKLISKNIKTSININDLTVNLLFVHGGDSHLLNGINLNNLIQVTFGDNLTNNYKIFKEENRISYINFKDLSNIFESIYSFVCQNRSFKIEDLYDQIFSFDPKLQSLQEPLQIKNLCEENEESTKNVEELNKYIENK